MINPHSVFGFLLREAGYVADEADKIVAVAGQVSGIVAAIPGVNPSSVFGKILEAIGYAADEAQKISGIGSQARIWIDVMQQIEGAAAEFQAHQPVTGKITIYGPYTYDFQPV